MTQYTVELTVVEDMALSFAALSQQEWISNAVKNRCRVAIDEIVKMAVDKAMEEGIQLPTSKEDVVMMAFEQGWIKTVAQRNAEYNALRTAQQNQEAKVTALESA